METTNKEKGFVKKLIENVTENVKEGATYVGGKIAKTSAKAFVAGSELVTETSEKIHDYSEKNALQNEEKKILKHQEKLKLAFGELSLVHYLANGTLHKSFLTTKVVSNLVEEYKANEKRMKELTKEIKKIEKN